MSASDIYVESEKLLRGTRLTRRLRSRLLYPILTSLMHRFLSAPAKFLNYGYAPLPGSSAFTTPVLLPEDEPDRLSIQLYHQITHAYACDRTVLEISCGHGGGAAYIARYLQPRSVLGIDWNPAAIRFCRSRYSSIPNLSFQVGDAEHLSLADQTVDAVVNVEASHCYGSMSQFLCEVKRVLRPSGHLLFADLRFPAQQSTLESLFSEAGFQICNQHDLTANVVAALQQDDKRKRHMLEKLPGWLQNSLAEFACAEGSQGYLALANRTELYLGYTLQRI